MNVKVMLQQKIYQKHLTVNILGSVLQLLLLGHSLIWPLQWFCFGYLFLPAQEQLNTRVGKILPNTPAATVQMQTGDKITAIDGTQVSTWERLNYALVDRVGETGNIQITAERDRASQKRSVCLFKVFLRDQSQSPLDVLGFTPYRPEIPAVVSKLSEDGAADTPRDESWEIVLLRLMA